MTVTDSAGVQIVTSTKPAWPAGEGWTLSAEPSLAIGENASSPNEEFTHIRRVFTLPGGLIAAVNQSRPPQIRIFDGGGRFVRSIGDAGAGPGEFRYIWDAWLAPPDTLVTFDAGLSRITMFGPDGDVRDMITFEQAGSAGLAAIPWDRFADGSFIMRQNRFVPEGTTGNGRSVVPVLRVSAQGQVIDTLGEFPDVDYVTMPSGAPNLLRYGAFSVQTVIGDRYYRGLGDDFTIDEYDARGRHLRSLRRSFGPRPVTDDLLARIRTLELDTVSEGRREFLENDWAARPHAATFRAYDANWIADAAGNLWIPGFVTPFDSATDWTVLDAGGRWLGSVSMPSAFRPEEIGTDYVLGVWKDEFDVETIRRYALDKG
jgi:6-bladed beta-propeller